MQPHAKMIDVLGAPLHIRVWGNASARHHLLYWHGRGATGLAINEAAPVLMERYDAQVISLDAPGFGQSPAREASAYELPQLAHMAKDLADAMGMSSFIFVGHSWGGAVGCHVAALYPQHVRRLILLDAGYMNPVDRSYTTDDAIEDAVNLYAGFQFDDWDAYLNEEKTHLPRWTEALAAACRTTMQEKDERIIPIITPQIIAALEHAYEQHPPASTYDALRQSKIPILLLAATLPHGFHPTRERLIAHFQASAPQLEVKTLPETGHDVPAYRGSQLADDMGKWLDSGKV